MSKRWVLHVLVATVLALAATLAALQLHRSGSAGGGRGTYEVTMLAKLALVGTNVTGPVGDSYEAPLLAAIEKAETSPSARDRARALRRKAIWCSFRERACVADALEKLAVIPPEDRAPAPVDEAAVLREILSGDAIAADRVPALEARLPEIRLGWFDHLLRERLFRHAGDAARADASLRAATGNAVKAMAAMFMFGGLLGAGVLAWLVILVLPARARILTRLAEGLRERGEAREGDSARQLAVVAAFFALSLVIPFAASAAGLSTDGSPIARAAWTLALEAVLLVVVLAAHRALAGKSLPLGFRRVSPLRALGVGALAYVLMWPVVVTVILPLGSLFERLGLPTQGHPIVEQLQAAGDDPGTLALWLVIAAVLAPLLEEAVFRGALHGAIRARLGGRAALLLVALLFAIIHPQVGLGLVGVFMVGLALSLVRIHEGSLWPGVVLHAINNGVALVLATALLSG